MRISTGEPSVINLDNFKKYQENLRYTVQQLYFPEKLTFHPKAFEGTISKDHPAYENLVASRNVVMTFSLSEIKAIYTDIFDLTEKAPLYMAYNKFDTQKKRGQMLTELRVLYEMFRLETVDNKLSDYLPSMLQLLQVTEQRNNPRTEKNIQSITMVIEDGTYVTASALGEDNSPYAYVIQTLEKTLKLCLTSPKRVRHHA